MSPLKRLWNVLRRDRLDDELRQEVDTPGAADDLAVEDGVPAIGVRGPTAPSLGDRA
jgi:hypothetical protein